jgi:sporulation protein YlmC with PRC-barrel domain
MLRRVQELKGDQVSAEDGEVGSVDDFYFDDRRWGVRFFVVATGPWLIGRKVLISSGAVEPRPAKGMRVRMTREQVEQSPAPGDPPAAQLLSSAQLVGYDIEAPDGAIGHVEDLVVDDESWEIADMVVDTRNWLPGGKRVLVPPTAVASIDAPAKKVRVRLSRDEVRNSPEARAAVGG